MSNTSQVNTSSIGKHNNARIDRPHPQKQSASSEKPSTTPSTSPKHVEAVPLDSRRGRHSLPAQVQDVKKLTRRSSKPIFNWFQRKLGGSVRARRASETARIARTDVPASERGKKRPPLPDTYHPLTRTQSTPSRGRSSADRDARRRSHVLDSPSPAIQATVSLDDDDNDDEERKEASTFRSSVARESLWSPTSHAEADEDASVRPLPPSSPPSPSPSHSSSSYLSDPRTFRSLAASTKPTTLLSVDMTNGMAHIAQAPPTPSYGAPRIGSHVRTSGGGSGGGNSISFSSLPTSHSPSQSTSGHATLAGPVQAPQLTHYHPRNNPRPSSPPPDNASVLTLASSAFGIPGARPGIVQSADAMSISQFSHFGGSRVGLEDHSSHLGLGDDIEVDRDWNASVRALRPRSSRRGSWDSEASGWSAKMGNGSAVVPNPSSPVAPRDKNTSDASTKLDQLSCEVGDTEPGLTIVEVPDSEPTAPDASSTLPVNTGSLDSGVLNDAAINDTEPHEPVELLTAGDPVVRSDDEKASITSKDVATPKCDAVELSPPEPLPFIPSTSQGSTDTASTAEPAPRTTDVPENETANSNLNDSVAKSDDNQSLGVDDGIEGVLAIAAEDGTKGMGPALPSPGTRSIAMSDAGTEIFVSAPSTPLPGSAVPAGLVAE